MGEGFKLTLEEYQILSTVTIVQTKRLVDLVDAKVNVVRSSIETAGHGLVAAQNIVVLDVAEQRTGRARPFLVRTGPSHEFRRVGLLEQVARRLTHAVGQAGEALLATARVCGSVVETRHMAAGVRAVGKVTSSVEVS